MFIFEVGSLVCAVAKNPTTLIVGRAIAGLGGSGVAVGVFTMLAFAAPPEKRPQILGFAGATYGIAAVIGPLIGGAFTENATWRWVGYFALHSLLITDNFVVFLHQPTNWGTGRRDCRVLFYGPRRRETSTGHMEGEALADGSGWCVANDGTDHLIHPGAAIWRPNELLGQQCCYRLVGWLCCHLRGLCRMGVLPEGARNDSSTTGEAHSKFPSTSRCANWRSL